MVLSIILLAASLSLDALGVGVVYGLRKIKVPFISKCIICIFSILYAGASLIIGTSLSSILPSYVSKVIGMSILIIMGIWIILQALMRKDDKIENGSIVKPEHKTLLKVAIKSLGITIQVMKNPVEGDIDKSGSIDWAESLLLGLALSVDAIGVGIGSALAGFHSIYIPFAVGLSQMACLYLGGFLGERFLNTSKVNKKIFSFIPGILLILLAIIRIY